MLKSLTIKNYALIDSLEVNFSKGLIIITGETGAGKSILLGGLSLILGKRADLSQLKNKSEKCIIEGVFDVEKFNLQSVFEDLDLDYENESILRREILSSGKSRAFVNDTPVTLDVLQTLSPYLIDVHSQHQTLTLTKPEYQFKVIDTISKNDDLLFEYQSLLSQYKSEKKQLEILVNSKEETIKEYDYNSFLLKELQEANLQSGQLKDLEEQHNRLQNSELIKESLSQVNQILIDENYGLIEQLNIVKNQLLKISNYSDSYQELFERFNSVSIELDDLLNSVDDLDSLEDSNPMALEVITEKLNQINALFLKHNTNDIDELISIQEQLEIKVSDTENLDDTIASQQKVLLQLESKLNQVAAQISKNRIKHSEPFIEQLESLLALLGMPNAKFKIDFRPAGKFLSNGKDNINFLFTANKGNDLLELKKAASGGELSRIMLSVKAILTNYLNLPTIMFDEIDTGVSGEIAKKMGVIMKKMSKKMQVFSITHLPQIASNGHSHFKVFKSDINEATKTQIKLLTKEERIDEIAHMLGGKELTQSAITHAKELLN